MNTDKESQTISTEAIEGCFVELSMCGYHKHVSKSRAELSALTARIDALEKELAADDRRVQEAREQMASKACEILCRRCDRAVRAECRENEGQCPECVEIRQAAKE